MTTISFETALNKSSNEVIQEKLNEFSSKKEKVISIDVDGWSVYGYPMYQVTIVHIPA